MYIDKDEIEEMLGEYYDFTKVTTRDWIKIDKAIKKECEKRGVNSIDDYDTYAAICDGCVGKIINKTLA